MTDWILISALKVLFAAFDALAPGRDRASDGSIGDAAHEREVSDHNPDETGSVPIHDADHLNEVHAIDVDDDLRVPGLTMERVVQFLLARCRSGAEKRLRYIIYNRRIWRASNGWFQETYTGPSAHTEHAHFSASYVAELEALTASWGLVEEFGDDMSEQEAYDGATRAMNDFFKVTSQAAPYQALTTSRIGRDALDQGIGNGTGGKAPAYNVLSDTAGRTVQILALVTGLAGKDFTDEPAIAAAVLAGLTPERLGAAITAAGLTPEAIAEAIPEEFADQVIDALSRRTAPTQ